MIAMKLAMKSRFHTLLVIASVLSMHATRPVNGQENPQPAAGVPAANQTRLRVAVAQIPVTTNIDANFDSIRRAMQKAVSEQADVLLTPEGSLSGYTHRFDQAKVEQALEKLVAEASASKLALVLGTCFVEPDDGKCYNELRFYDRDGKLLGFHTKTLRCGTMTDPPVGEINHYGVRPLRTFTLNGITVGGLICNDMWANPSCTPMPDPHLSHQLAKMKTRVVFHAINGGRGGSDWSRDVAWPFHESNLRIRARTSKLWIVTADNCDPVNLPCSAPSGVLRPNGQWAAQAPAKGEHVVVYTIELDGSETQ